MRGRVLGGMMALALTVGMVSGGTYALAGIGGAAVLYFMAVAVRRKLLLPHPLALFFGGGLLALALLADLTAFAPARSWAMTLRLATIIAPLTLLFIPREPIVWPRWFFYLPWAILGVEIFMIAELGSGGKILMPFLHAKDDSLTYYNRGLSYAAVLLWPLCAMLIREKRARLAAALLAGLLIASWISPSRGAPLALAAGAALGSAAWASRRLGFALGLALLGVVAAGSLAAAPWLVEKHQDWLAHFPPSWRHRVEIWDYLLARLAENPWIGLGPDAAGALPVGGGHQSLYVYALFPAAHPHHVALQLWLELGPLGWLLGAGLAVVCLARMSPWPALERAAGMAAFGACLTLACGSFSLWTDSLLALMALTIFWCRHFGVGDDADVFG